MSNDNRTILYRIRRKSDGRFLESNSNVPACYGHWTRSGVFFKKPETIERHLVKLCTMKMYCGENGSVFKKRPNKCITSNIDGYDRTEFFSIWPAHTYMHTVGFMPQWLDKYEVVATEISEHGSSVVCAKEFVNLDQKGKENATHIG